VIPTTIISDGIITNMASRIMMMTMTTTCGGVIATPFAAGRQQGWPGHPLRLSYVRPPSFLLMAVFKQANKQQRSSESWLAAL